MTGSSGLVRFRPTFKPGPATGVTSGSADLEMSDALLTEEHQSGPLLENADGDEGA